MISDYVFLKDISIKNFINMMLLLCWVFFLIEIICLNFFNGFY